MFFQMEKISNRSIPYSHTGSQGQRRDRKACRANTPENGLKQPSYFDAAIL